MIRLTIDPFRAESAEAAARMLRAVADQLEEGYTLGIIPNADVESVRYDVDELCEYCDGEREITSGPIGEEITKPCFNCAGPDEDDQRDQH